MLLFLQYIHIVINYNPPANTQHDESQRGGKKLREKRLCLGVEELDGYSLLADGFEKKSFAFMHF